MLAARPANAAYGEAANVFGSATNASGAPRRLTARRCSANLTRYRWGFALTPAAPRRAGFVPYAGDGYAMLLPGKWNPSKEREFAGMDVRCVAQHSCLQLRRARSRRRARSYEDNFDAVNNLFVIVKPAEKSKMEARTAAARKRRLVLSTRSRAPAARTMARRTST